MNPLGFYYKQRRKKFRGRDIEAHRAYMREYARTHKKEFRERHKKWYEANKEHSRQYSKNYWTEHKEERRESQRRYKLRKGLVKKGVGSRICTSCGTTIQHNESMKKHKQEYHSY